MNPALGTLHKNNIIVDKTKDIGRIFGKSKFGMLLSKNELHLDYLEACFLSEEKKLEVYDNGKRISFEKLISIAATKQERFETNYLIFRDLRHRGHQIQLLDDDSIFNFFTTNNQEQQEPPSLIATFSERESCSIQRLLDLIEESKKQNTRCWITIADEEGDITYYDLDSNPLTGEKKPSSLPHTNGILLKDRVLIFNEKSAHILHEKEFFGKQFVQGIQISLVEALYLIKKNNLEILLPTGEKISSQQAEKIVTQRQIDMKKRYIVYNDLKKQGLLVKTGFKFGNHFRAYSAEPDKTHAEYLIHAVPFKDTLEWAEVSRAIRLAHSVKKIFLFASINEKEQIHYIAFKRIRP